MQSLGGRILPLMGEMAEIRRTVMFRGFCPGNTPVTTRETVPGIHDHEEVFSCDTDDSPYFTAFLQSVEVFRFWHRM